MLRICRWEPKNPSGDTTSAIIRLREQLDDLTAQDVECDNEFWWSENWQDHLLPMKSRYPTVLDPCDCTAKYLGWYLEVSHPTTQNPEIGQSTSRKVDVH